MNFKKFLLLEGLRFLVEYRDWLAGRTKEYGAWIDPDERKVHYVDHEGHTDFIKQMIKKQGGNPSGLTENDLYELAFKAGLIRVVFEGPILNLEGDIKALERAGAIIFSTFNTTPKITAVNVDRHKLGRSAGSKTFLLPKEKYQLAQYINFD